MSGLKLENNKIVNQILSYKPQNQKGSGLIKRKYFIKDILSDMYKSFQTIEFQSFRTFIKILETRKHFSKKVLRINIGNLEELKFMSMILGKTNLDEDNAIELKISSKLFIESLDNILSDIY